METEALLRLLQGDRFAAHAGIKLREVKRGYACAEMRLEENHLNGVGITQGGALFTLADLTFAAVANSYGHVAVAIQANIVFHRATKSGVLIAEGREVSRSRTIATHEVLVKDEQGNRIATFTGLSYTKGDKIE